MPNKSGRSGAHKKTAYPQGMGSTMGSRSIQCTEHKWQHDHRGKTLPSQTKHNSFFKLFRPRDLDEDEQLDPAAMEVAQETAHQVEHEAVHRAGQEATHQATQEATNQVEDQDVREEEEDNRHSRAQPLEKAHQKGKEGAPGQRGRPTKAEAKAREQARRT